MIILETTVKNKRKRHIRGYKDGDYMYPFLDEVILHDELNQRICEIFEEYSGIFTNDIDIIKILKEHYEMYNLD